MPTGEPVHAYDLSNRRGTVVTVLTLGAIIAAVEVAGRDGERDDVVLGVDDVDGYLTRSPYFGAVTGRYGNRIAQGRFTLDGVTYSLATNNAPNHLHGGVVGFDKRLYTARAVASSVPAFRSRSRNVRSIWCCCCSPRTIACSTRTRSCAPCGARVRSPMRR